jgi:chromate transporter
MHESTNIQKGKQFQFLKTVLWLGLTAFGGPQMHLPHFKKRLIERKRFITQEDLIEITAFCNLLPGPTTTQTITTVGLKLGGPKLAILTVLFWALPGATLMLLLALSPKFLSAHQLQYISATVVGFMVYGFLSMSQWMEKTPLNWGILIDRKSVV